MKSEILLKLFILFATIGMPQKGYLQLHDGEVKAVVKNVLEGGDKGRSALRKAVLNSGIAIREANNSISQPALPSQELVINYWELDALNRMTSLGITVSFRDFIAMLNHAIPYISSRDWSDLILVNIFNRKKTKNSSIDYWSSFITELSRQSDSSYTIGKDLDIDALNLNAIQVVLILERLTADLFFWCSRAIIPPVSFKLNRIPTLAAYQKTRQAEYGFARANLLVIRNAVSNYSLVSMAPDCSNSDHHPFLPDAFAFGFTTVFDKLSDHIIKITGKEVLEKAKIAITGANTFLAYSKLILTYASLDVNISMNNEPLVRNYDGTRGQDRVLTAKVIMRQDLNFINCLRASLNAMGLDMDITKFGPVEGAGIEWKLVDGFVEFDYSKVQGSISSLRTNKDGIVQTTIWGMKRMPPLRHAVTRLMKVFTVRVNVQIEPPQPVATIFDALPLIPQLISPTAVLNLLPELVYKTRWYSSQPFSFVIQDWTAAGWEIKEDIAWSGKICKGFDKPFFVNFEYGMFTAEFKFEPGGRWKAHGKLDNFGDIAKIIGQGTFELDTSLVDAPKIKMISGDFYGIVDGNTIKLKPSEQFLGGRMIFELRRVTSECAIDY